MFDYLDALLIRVHLFHKTLTNSLLKQCLDDNIETNELNILNTKDFIFANMKYDIFPYLCIVVCTLKECI